MFEMCAQTQGSDYWQLIHFLKISRGNVIEYKLMCCRCQKETLTGVSTSRKLLYCQI